MPAGAAAVDTATFSSSTLALGSNHPITASYPGDSNFLTSGAAAPLTQTVNQDQTTTSVASTANPSVFGQLVTLTATVKANSPGANSFTGETVTFMDGGATLGTGTLSGGQATTRAIYLSFPLDFERGSALVANGQTVLLCYH